MTNEEYDWSKNVVEVFRYVAGWNAPGYLPDMEPMEFLDADAAKRFLIEEAKTREDDAGASEDEDTAADWSFFAEDLNVTSAFRGMVARAPDGSEWWIHRRSASDFAQDLVASWANGNRFHVVESLRGMRTFDAMAILSAIFLEGPADVARGIADRMVEKF